MIGKIFITSSGYDPQYGKHIKDPYLGANASLGACRPDIRRQIKEVDRKVTAQQAYDAYPDQRLQVRVDGQVSGNIIVDANGAQHELDDHNPATFAKRTPNYVVGTDCVALVSPEEIALGREQTLDVLRETFKKDGGSPWEIVGHYGSLLTEEQVRQLRQWLLSLKKVAKAA
jgi:hypothetical protein